MKIGSTNGNVGASIIQMPMQQGNDSFSKNIQNQIANAQKQMQELGDNKELSVEDKMKKRQEIQKQISDLQNQLRQHQMEQRMQNQQKKGSSMEDMLGGKPQARKASKGGSGMSSASMQAIISADSSMKQVKTQGAVKSEMEGNAGILKSEIKLDEARGNDVTKKKEELAEVESKAEDITASQMSILSETQKNLEEAAKEDQKVSKTEGKDKTKKKDTDNKVDGDKDLSEVEAQQGVTVDADGSSSEERADAIPDGVTISTSDPVGSNVDVKL